MSTQVWRVLTPYGTSHDVTVRDDGSSWWARNPGGVIGTAFRGDTPNRAVLRLAERLGWEVTEIRAPGKSTTAERVATLTQERDEAAQVARDVVFRCMLKHPLPWHVERDWTHEVTAADGAIVAKCSGDARAAAVIALAERIRAEIDATDAETAAMLAEDERGGGA